MKSNAHTRAHTCTISLILASHEWVCSYRVGHINDSNLSTCPTWLLIPSTQSLSLHCSLYCQSARTLNLCLRRQHHLLYISYSSEVFKWSISLVSFHFWSLHALNLWSHFSLSFFILPVCFVYFPPPLTQADIIFNNLRKHAKLFQTF